MRIVLPQNEEAAWVPTTDILPAWNSCGTIGILRDDKWGVQCPATAIGQNLLVTHAHQHLPDLVGMIFRQNDGRSFNIIKTQRPFPDIDIGLIFTKEQISTCVPLATTWAEPPSDILLIDYGQSANRVNGEILSGGNIKWAWAMTQSLTKLTVSGLVPNLSARLDIGGPSGSGGGIFHKKAGVWTLIGVITNLGPTIPGTSNGIGYDIVPITNFIAGMPEAEKTPAGPPPSPEAPKTPTPQLPKLSALAPRQELVVQRVTLDTPVTLEPGWTVCGFSSHADGHFALTCRTR